MKRILILNGPNLNMLGTREPQIYGTDTLSDIMERTAARFAGRAAVEWSQSNHEGALIDAIQQAHAGGYDGIVLNAGAYTHTSLAIADAIASVHGLTPVVEVHLSNTAAREEIRRRSLIAPVCIGSIAGFGADSYVLGVESILLKNQR